MNFSSKRFQVSENMMLRKPKIEKGEENRLKTLEMGMHYYARAIIAYFDQEAGPPFRYEGTLVVPSS